MTNLKLIKLSTEQDVIQKLAQLIEKSANDAITENSVFRIGLSGGSLTKYLSTGLPNIKTDWSKWQMFFCDERFVPVDDPDSTFGVYKENLIPKTDLKESQFVLIDGNLELEDCAKDYQAKISKSFNNPTSIPVFDLLLLGMGPDGHTCSLFPSHQLLSETNCLIAPISDSPKPPPKRVTMTYPLINNAKCCIFAMAGSGKADMLKRIFVDKEDLPAGKVNPTNGSLIWILDESAASLLD